MTEQEKKLLEQKYYNISVPIFFFLFCHYVIYMDSVPILHLYQIHKETIELDKSYSSYSIRSFDG